MKKILVIMLILAFGACQTSTNQNVESQKTPPPTELREMPNVGAKLDRSEETASAAMTYKQIGNVYKHLQGTIGAKQVQIDLLISPKGIMGSYYDNEKNYYHLEGDTLQWIAAAVSAGGLNTIKAQIQDAHFSNAQTLVGNFVPVNKGVKAAPVGFSLTENYDQSVPIRVLQSQEKLGNCASNADKSCCLIDLVYPQIETNNNNVLSANQQIERAVADFANAGSSSVAQAVQAVTTKYNNAKNKGRWEITTSPSILYNYNNILSLKLTQTRIASNDVRPISPIKYLNFDTQTGKTLLLADIFKAGYEASLRKQIQQKILVDAGEEMREALGNNMRLPQNFYLTPQGLTILYNPGEILPPQAGDFSATLSFIELKAILKNSNLGNNL